MKTHDLLTALAHMGWGGYPAISDDSGDLHRKYNTPRNDPTQGQKAQERMEAKQRRKEAQIAKSRQNQYSGHPSKP